MHPKTLFAIAVDAKKDGDNLRAMKALSKIIDEHPDSPQFETALAMKRQLGNTGEPAVTKSASTVKANSSGISKVISVFGWLVVMAGILFAAFELKSGRILGLLPSVGLAVSGLLLVVVGQITRARGDNAAHTSAILALLNKNKKP